MISPHHLFQPAFDQIVEYVFNSLFNCILTLVIVVWSVGMLGTSTDDSTPILSLGLTPSK